MGLNEGCTKERMSSDCSKKVGVLTISRIDSEPPLKRAGGPNKLAAYLLPALVHSLHSLPRGSHRQELLPDAGGDNL